MTAHRFYNCGCEPDFDRYCKEADKRVQEARSAMLSWCHDDWMAAEQNDRLENQIQGADRWLAHHLSAQDRAGAFTDVEEKELEPPDDGYDEDPRIVGYPS